MGLSNCRTELVKLSVQHVLVSSLLTIPLVLPWWYCCRSTLQQFEIIQRFLAERCNSIASSAIVIRCSRPSVWGGFQLCDAISQKWCEIEPRWQLITNSKSYMAFNCNKRRWPWMSIYCFVVSVMRIVTKRLRPELRDFHYKVPLRLSYLHIKFDDKI